MRGHSERGKEFRSDYAVCGKINVILNEVKNPAASLLYAAGNKWFSV